MSAQPSCTEQFTSPCELLHSCLPFRAHNKTLLQPHISIPNKIQALWTRKPDFYPSGSSLQLPHRLSLEVILTNRWEKSKAKKGTISQNRNTQSCLWSGDSPWHSPGSQALCLNFTPKKDGFVLSWNSGQSCRKLTLRARIPPGLLPVSGWRQCASFELEVKSAVPVAAVGSWDRERLWQEQEERIPLGQSWLFQPHSWDTAWAT